MDSGFKGKSRKAKRSAFTILTSGQVYGKFGGDFLTFGKMSRIAAGNYGGSLLLFCRCRARTPTTAGAKERRTKCKDFS